MVSSELAKNRPTMRDVAAAAGVSTALVSLVFRDSPNVSQHRRTRVLDAADALGFRPNALARGLASRFSRTIGVLINDLHNPWFAEMYDGAEQAATAAGYQILLTTGNQRTSGEMRAINTMMEQRVDAIVLAGPRVSGSSIKAVCDEVPVVTVGRAFVGINADSVMANETVGAALAVDHLASLGHRTIVHIDGGQGAGAAPRRAGYVRAMKRIGLPADVIGGDFSEAAGIAGVENLMRRKQLPDAIFAANDLVAFGVMGALATRGRSVPGDVSLVGYDNTATAHFTPIGLTSVDQPREAMGELAIALLLERLTGQRLMKRNETLVPTLVVRTTSALR